MLITLRADGLAGLWDLKICANFDRSKNQVVGVKRRDTSTWKLHASVICRVSM